MEINIFKSIFVFFLLSLLNTVWYLLLPGDKFHEDNCFFRERKWEEKGLFYQRVFKVKQWKDILPELGDFLPVTFKKKKIVSFDKEYVKQFIAETCRAEICHWSIIFTVFLYFLYQANWINTVMLVVAVLINIPFIIIQRYNRPRMAAMMKRQDRNSNKIEKCKVQHMPSMHTGKILFISADNTGNGHKSITEALRHQIKKLDATKHLEVVDGFSMGNYFFRVLSNLYSPIAVNAPLIWGWLYRLSNHMVNAINVMCSRIIKKKLLQLLEELKPDIIISVHAFFTGSVTRILEKNHMEIPVISFVADLDNVSNLWADSRAKYILCPTKEAEDKMKSLGISSERLRVVGFPVREEFCSDIPDIDIEAKDSANGSISVLFISGSQGSRQVLKMAKKLLENGKCNVTIIAGKNEVLRKQLEKELAEYSEEQVSIIGFTKEIKEYMAKADILILRASPNVLMEAVNLCKPIIIIGALKGQEEKNPEFIEKYQLGCICENYKKISSVIQELYAFNQEKIVSLKNNMVRFRNPEAAYNIAVFIIQQCNQQIKEYRNTKEIKSNRVIHDMISQ
ncbi:glycosyltransferase [Clostridium sp. BJN0013]|uniref:glycosyl-4,4'-diaponeurosporenoate acyltransferase CrtO family protein n=1 Tax=Clostridium sp. BJN0013 TaxID=3236840 RepID=UPI0034C5BB95